MAKATEESSGALPAKVVAEASLAGKVEGEDRDTWLREHDLFDASASEDAR